MAFSVEKYRRFVERTSVKLHGDMIAVVGPNEAGKSSLLRALAHLEITEPFAPNEKPRRTKAEPTLEWHFQLEEADRSAIAEIHDTGGIERAVVIKRPDGKTYWRFEPHRPGRDRTRRHDVATLLQAHRDDDALRRADDDHESEFSLEKYDNTIETLLGDVEDYDTAQISSIRDLASQIVAVSYPLFDDTGDVVHVKADDKDEDEARVGEADEDHEEDNEQAWNEVRDAMTAALTAVADDEVADSPVRQVITQLNSRLPHILLFTDDDRELSSQYDLTDVADSPPGALSHLAFLANLDLVALRDEALSQAIPDVATRRNDANRRLLEVFGQSWNQQGIAVQVDVQGTILHIQATAPEDPSVGLSDIGEHSDGMLWFAALLAFAHGWKDKPILLVDEIERHLHYDAQADLIDVLAKQQFTSKVIYTTHSFGCLPHDLGTGVRVVQPIDATTSRLENGFWKTGSGFSPLLASMGAAAMSFTPTRHAVIAEGQSDAILLPTLLRQSSDGTRLGFQVGPGLSSVAAASVHNLDAEAGTVCYIVDGDKGGSDIADKLTAAGVASARIISLSDPATGSPLEVEDLIDGAVYAKALNEELRCWQTVSTEVTPADLDATMRTKALETWCLAHDLTVPDKVPVAQRVVDLAADRSILAEDRAEFVRSLLGRVRELLHLP